MEQGIWRPEDCGRGRGGADLKIYPDLLSHVIESLEGMLQRPWGCGEQTVSSTYPSVLLLKFEKQRRRSLGTLHDRAMRYVALGYTRLLSMSFTPRMAIDAQSAPHTLFDYYNPDASVTVAPDRFIVEP